MLVHASCTLLLLALFYGSNQSQVDGAPATYDQRQNGDFNVDAKLENFMVLVATSGGSLLSNLATHAAELNELIGERSKGSLSKGSEAVVYETEDSDVGREPYRVEIVRIEKEGDKGDVHEAEKDGESIDFAASTKSAENSDNSSSDVEVAIDGKKAEKKIRSLWKNEHASNGKKKPLEHLRMENLEHPDHLSVKEETPKAARPGISLKKQLSKKEEEHATSVSERNELGNNKYEELVLIGGGIENCGPGRYRDKSGVCQFDKDFNLMYPIS